MKIDLTDTTAGKINKALVKGRREIGTPAVGMVLTLVIVTDEENAYDALKAAGDASREHPSRTLVVIRRVSRSPRDRTQSRIDAEVLLGADAGTGETVVLRLHGEVSDHAQSVVLPLLLPDAPVVVWWPVDAPADPANDPLGALAQRRVTDSYAAEQPVRALTARAKSYAPGDTDLSWTRITPWRSMLAAALDQVTCEVTSVEVEGEEFNPSCELLAMWLADRLDVPVRRTLSAGPGLTAVRLSTDAGPIALDRPDGSVATLSIQGQPDRAVALKRRDTVDLIAEELRRLDPDDTYASALRFGVERLNSSVSTAFPAPVTRKADGGAATGSAATSTPGAGTGAASTPGAGSGAAAAPASGPVPGSAARSLPAPPAPPASALADPVAVPKTDSSVEGARKSGAAGAGDGGAGGAGESAGGAAGATPPAPPAAAQAPVLPAEAPQPVRKAISP
ncbi:glucose-6-phosphate dehydrogenase assembly protein OpcA [Streptomyces niveiscabiei]|uniref:glucose-6-phosphate dehydrogenase assembly protein OpcA n=1 Tax=Streptomyces niveiscabiei TaxID=164115 RepID=UPI0029B0DD0C|nr:glucose-6-phosphate dehydrogenase assembly protein OpcA [Streptomyces niveiscabiei]MDX3381422.1 glucose-6-phosphate dehydrogenase assembly protein OpcA [Streptomyces niveiscabiei]